MDETLSWNGRIWHGHTTTHCLSMSHETLQKYVTAYQEGLSGQLILTPQETMAYISQLSYWAYARYDRAILLLRLPECILTREERNEDR